MTKIARPFLLLGLLFVPLLSWAQSSYSVLIDSDNDTNTGCDTTNPFALSGIEQRLQATVDPASMQITALTLERCKDGVFDAPTALPGVPYSAGVNNGVSAEDVVEMAVAANAIALPG